jgi:plastocyanin
MERGKTNVEAIARRLALAIQYYHRCGCRLWECQHILFQEQAGTAKEVHMNSTSFVQAALTIQKGQSVTLVNDDAFTPHIIANGAWENGTPKPAKEVGAPSVNNVQINGDSSQTIGPFTTAGTFHFYCTIHPGMELAVIVQ